MKILLSLSIVLFFGSCTMTKRLHHPGWHVEWKSSKLKNQEIPNEQEIARDNLTKTEAHSSSAYQPISLENKVGYTETTSIHAQQESSFDEVLNDQQQHHAENVHSTNQKKLKNQPENQSAADTPKPEPLGILSIFAGSTALIFFLNICLLLSDNGWNAILGLSYPWLFLILFALAALGVIMGIVSYKRIKENPELYKGKGRAIVGMYMSYFSGGLGLAVLLGIGLFYLFETFFSW